jgi:hypothetical protein
MKEKKKRKTAFLSKKEKKKKTFSEIFNKFLLIFSSKRLDYVNNKFLTK